MFSRLHRLRGAFLATLVAEEPQIEASFCAAIRIANQQKSFHLATRAGGTYAVAFRSDGSGTTYIWTDYLAKVNEEWNKEIGFGTSVPWPVGVGGQGNGGVAAIVKQTAYSIGYVELAYAMRSKLPYGFVKIRPGTSSGKP